MMSFRLPLFAALLIAFSVGTAGACSGCGPTPEDCKNGKDDDNNGKTDCDDAACVGDAACAAGEGEGEGVGEGEGEGGEGEGEGEGPAVEICDPFDFTDEDNDGLISCDDPDCAGDAQCVEICDNFFDDNNDGFEDCDDPQCATDPACLETNCTNLADDDNNFAVDRSQ